MASDITRGKTAAECGYVSPDPRTALADIRMHLGLAEGHIASVHRLMRQLEGALDQSDVDRSARAA